ncbi:hypothetical protein RFI_38707 [Reticulomyxa filosa]|uniref:Uncharacterized protein n=1 Tax=Reticulomyxa filosa TaxID=46433 RepID=X6LBM9_RETFI|nr:hypothetical protein RFI_38707 [Reticulomyxa filosa]|eukprot:ETN98780.1 hypothetical protein RFI_38707 [Reticulomyxa filosa]
MVQSELAASQQREDELQLQVENLEEKLQEEKSEYQRDIQMLKEKMASLTTLSQEEIQQAFELSLSATNDHWATINELKDMLNTTKHSSKDQKSALSTTAAISKPIQTQTQTQTQTQMQMQNSNAIANANDTSVNNGNASNVINESTQNTDFAPHKISSHKLIQDLLQSLEEVCSICLPKERKEKKEKEGRI